MKIAGLPKIGPCGIDSCQLNIPERNGDPWKKTTNDEQNCSQGTGPLEKTHVRYFGAKLGDGVWMLVVGCLMLDDAN